MLRIREIMIFLGIFGFIVFSSHFYMFQRISYYLQITGNQRAALAWLLGAFALFTVIVVPLSRLLPPSATTMLAWAIYPWMGFALLMFVTLLVTDTVWLLLKLVPWRQTPDHRLLLQYCFGAIALSAAIMLGSFSLWNGLRPVTIKPLNIVLQRLPKSLDGLRIVQITDLHIGPLIKGEWLRQVVNKVNALKPDLIVITGDLVDGSVEDLGHHVASIADLQAPQGIYFVTGNHEYYSGVEQWCGYISKLGIRVLRNERVSISVDSNDNSFDLAGVDDWSSRHSPETGANLQKVLRGRNPNKTLILLAHQPAAVHEAAAQGVDLQLSGHTHGGQIWPFTYLVYLQQPYTQGLYRHGDTDTQIYISPGTGFWGPPMRLGTSAEITLITLHSGS
jgi:predicted MPP superfamily phosphohydrolase